MSKRSFDGDLPPRKKCRKDCDFLAEEAQTLCPKHRAEDKIDKLKRKYSRYFLGLSFESNLTTNQRFGPLSSPQKLSLYRLALLNQSDSYYEKKYGKKYFEKDLYPGVEAVLFRFLVNDLTLEALHRFLSFYHKMVRKPLFSLIPDAYFEDVDYPRLYILMRYVKQGDNKDLNELKGFLQSELINIVYEIRFYLDDWVRWGYLQADNLLHHLKRYPACTAQLLLFLLKRVIDIPDFFRARLLEDQKHTNILLEMLE